MAVERLTDQEKRVVRACLQAVLALLDEAEFAVVMGVERDEVAKLLKTWPSVDDSADDSVAAVVINNAMNNVLGYPFTSDELQVHLDASPQEVAATFQKWRHLKGRATGKD